ncbi:MAG: hypothetical protein GY820_43225 [Gammaproteobacteria bacterium]|nr:hypothetical protein [Gammaproteobacteria bacterium]
MENSRETENARENAKPIGFFAVLSKNLTMTKKIFRKTRISSLVNQALHGCTPPFSAPLKKIPLWRYHIP